MIAADIAWESEVAREAAWAAEAAARRSGGAENIDLIMLATKAMVIK
jgi:hypothetical protein